MSEVLAGIAGGLLALAGAFGVQWVADRNTRKARLKQVTARYLTALWSIEFHVDFTRDSVDVHQRDERSLLIIAAQQNLSTLGYEFMLLSDGRTSELGYEALTAAFELLKTTLADDATHADHSRRFNEAADALEAHIRTTASPQPAG